ncbi:hypothetical protein Leryth_008708 [Lithospermum erythrorhizon]|nr:hypothetical protein Leryth_008708 [Lithospermum erythrorhizon]
MESPNSSSIESQLNSIQSPNSNSDSNSTPIIQFPPLRYFHSPLSSLLEYSGLFRLQNHDSEAQPLINSPINHNNNNNIDSSIGNNGGGEVAIRIIGGEVAEEEDLEAEGGGGNNENNNNNNNDDDANNNDDNIDENSDNTTSYQRYDIQRVARWIEQILPFSLLLLVVFIRQHLQGFFVTIWVTAFLFKSNDIVRKQTALKGERRIAVLIAYFVLFVLHVVSIYWWFCYEDLYYPLFMVPPKTIPPFWHAIFIILVNDSMARQAAMAIKLILLMYYKNGRGHNFRRQGQLLTLVEYTLLLYRALLPAPVWYRFFLNKEYGSLFSSLTTGLYLTFKLTSIVEKVQSFFAALKALSKKDVNYGTYATSEQEEIYVLSVRKRCMTRYYCDVNISSAKIASQNGLKGRELALCAGLCSFGNLNATPAFPCRYPKSKLMLEVDLQAYFKVVMEKVVALCMYPGSLENTELYKAFL